MSDDSKALVRFEQYCMPEPNSGCWIWIGAIKSNGYGEFHFNRKTVHAHRWYYEHCFGAVPKGLELDHRCRVRCCVNPYHLEPVTRSINRKRGLRDVPQAVCKRGHEFSGHNAMILKDGRRTCRLCLYQRIRTYQQRRRMKSNEC